MKHVRISWLAVLAVAGTLTLTPAQAADQSTTRPEQRQGQRPGQGQGQEQRRQQMRQQRMERLSQELGLTDVQKKRVEALWDKEMAKMRELRAAGQPDQAQRREQMQTLRKELNAEMKKLLTTEQFAKYEKLQNERVNQIRQGGQRGQGQGGQGQGGNR